MIITSVIKIPRSDVEQYAWRRISQFQNIEFTTKFICTLHKLDAKQASNAKRQAEQIKFCLTQAKEYFDASKSVSLATRPVLLYYCTMSLALAEILLKQSGESRLSALRANHNCHGLTLGIGSDPRPDESLDSAASKLIAKAQTGSDGRPKGTFEVWRRSAREYPLGGLLTQAHGSATTSGYRMLFIPSDTPPPVLPAKGVNLLSCLTNLPYMGDALARWGSQLNMVRATVSREAASAFSDAATTVIVHPTSPQLLDAFGQRCRICPEFVNHLDFQELPSGLIFSWKANDLFLSLPHSTCITTEDAYFTCSSENIGEFGYLYLSFHILGNFARYYPDLWIKHIEANSPLASAADDLCNNALARLPLLTLSELSRTYHVTEK